MKQLFSGLLILLIISCTNVTTNVNDYFLKNKNHKEFKYIYSDKSSINSTLINDVVLIDALNDFIDIEILALKNTFVKYNNEILLLENTIKSDGYKKQILDVNTRFYTRKINSNLFEYITLYKVNDKGFLIAKIQSKSKKEMDLINTMKLLEYAKIDKEKLEEIQNTFK